LLPSAAAVAAPLTVLPMRKLFLLHRSPLGITGVDAATAAPIAVPPPGEVSLLGHSPFRIAAVNTAAATAASICVQYLKMLL
jgi:hypothetical protein